MKWLSLVVIGVAALYAAQAIRNFDIYYQWKTVEYDLPPNIQLSSSDFIQENNFIATLKIFEHRMWITTPRYRRGVPVTLSTVPYIHQKRWEHILLLHNQSPKLLPFPNYEMNQIGNCDALQTVQSMEIDQFGRLWVVDVGRVNILEEIFQEGPALNLCPAKLVIFDVNNGRSGKKFTYIFPNETASNTSNIMKDIQVACTTREDCWAYISDIGASRLVVYDHKNKQSWTAQHPWMAQDPTKTNFSINGAPTMAPFGVTGLGLAPKKFKFSYIHFSPLASITMYKINTDILRNPNLKQNGTLNPTDVMIFGEKPGQSDGFGMSSTGILYYGNLPGSSVLSTKTSPQLLKIGEQRTVVQSNTAFSWPDCFSFDGNGKVALTTTKFQLFASRMIDTSEFNYRVVILKHTGAVFAYNSC